MKYHRTFGEKFQRCCDNVSLQYVKSGVLDDLLRRRGACEILSDVFERCKVDCFLTCRDVWDGTLLERGMAHKCKMLRGSTFFSVKGMLSCRLPREGLTRKQI